MDKKDIALRKLALALGATKAIQAEDNAIKELKTAAFEALLLNPGSEFGDWQQILVEEYPTEVVDAYGENPEDVYAALSDLWEMPYEDIASGLEYTFSTWAETFCNEASVRMYYDMIERLKTQAQCKRNDKTES